MLTLRYDAKHMRIMSIGAITKKCERAKRSLLEDWKSGRQGWLGCPDDAQRVGEIQHLAKEYRRFNTCLVIGIGGSDLGARAAWHALKSRSRGMRLEFAGGNTDPDELKDTLAQLDWRTTLVNVISKSGETLEPMITFFVVREILQKKIGKTFANHIIATTDASRGALRDLANREGYATLAIPETIGGRFSVLTSVGLFPLACAGIDVNKMLRGAREIRNSFLAQSASMNDPVRFGAFHAIGDMRHGRNIHVLMPYSERLKLFAIWYRQLWAESLGKDGKGPTPIAALGATDQHSQLQLYADGPMDKLVTFIEVEQFDSARRVPSTVFPSLNYARRKTFERIIHAERAATAHALAEKGRPNGTLVIPRVDEASFGALCMFFLIATGIAGELYGINTYNEPGVAASKRAAIRMLVRDP